MMPRTGRPKTTRDHHVECRVCGAPMVVPDYRIRRGDGKYCSRQCFHESRVGRPNIGSRVEPAAKNCLVCGQEFLAGGGGRPPSKQMYCSRECQYKASGTQPRPHTLDPLDAAWLGGLFDGEGSIVFPRKKQSKSARMSIHNTCKPLIDKVYEVTGTGRIFDLSKYRLSPKHSDVWVWQCYGENARNLLRQIYPRLIVKKEKADRALSEPLATNQQTFAPATSGGFFFGSQLVQLPCL